MKYPIPLLVFADDRGLGLPAFNTFRLGVAWSKRLKRGDKVLIAFKHEVLACMKVEYVAAGPVNEILQEYASGNHIELSMALDPGYSIALAPHRRLDSMRKNYGPQKVTPTAKVTVIGLRR